MQHQMIETVRERALANTNISAVLMYGSFANGEGDNYSDIEFYIFLKDAGKLNKREWISEVRPVEMLFTNEFGTDVAVFDNLIRGEFHFLPVSEISVIRTWQGYLDFSVWDKMRLVDKDGLLAEVFDSIEQISPEWNTPDNLSFVADAMVNNLIFVANVIARGENARAAHLFFYIEKYLASLIRLHCGNTNHWLDPMKGLEKEIPAEWYEKYVACVPGLNKSSLSDSYKLTLKLTQELFFLLDVPQHNILLVNKLITIAAS